MILITEVNQLSSFIPCIGCQMMLAIPLLFDLAKCVILKIERFVDASKIFNALTQQPSVVILVLGQIIECRVTVFKGCFALTKCIVSRILCASALVMLAHKQPQCVVFVVRDFINC